jgi:hypothetical protein
MVSIVNLEIINHFVENIQSSKQMKLLLTGLIALSMVGYSRADGFGAGMGFGIGMAIANRVLSGGGQPRQRERVVEHRTVVHERVIHEKAAPVQAPTNTTVIVNNNLPAQPATQLTSTTTVNAKTSAVTSPPAQVATTAPAATAPTLAPVLKPLGDDVTVN